VEEPSALECLPVHPREIHPVLLVLLVLLVHLVPQVRSGILEILRRVPALEKIPYVIAPFNE